MDLPQELIDEIISHIPPGDWESLRNCSLVAKSWVHPTRRHVFKDVDISATGLLKLWSNKIPPMNIGILRHVRSLQYQITKPFDSPHLSPDFLHDYLPSFSQLERLTLFSGPLPSLTWIATSPAFRHTLSYLQLQGCNVTANALVTFVNYFPNLAHLELIDVDQVDTQPAPPFSRPLKKLSVIEFTDLGLIYQLMALRPQCDEVNIDMWWASCPLLAQHVIDGVGAGVKRLNIECRLEGVSNVSKSLV